MNNSEMKRALEIAIEEETAVQITYRSYSKDQITTRVVVPLGLNRTGGGYWLLSAFCAMRHEYRSFRLDRMRHVEEARFGVARPHLHAIQRTIKQTVGEAFKEGLPQFMREFRRILRVELGDSAKDYLDSDELRQIIREELAGDPRPEHSPALSLSYPELIAEIEKLGGKARRNVKRTVLEEQLYRLRSRYA
jgi:predicted DNA-binding transcriptional regulator YafY